MTKQHTPKTWRAIYVGSSDWDLDGPITQEDWQLAAAAPDLLEALMEANAELEYLNDPKGYVSIRQEKIMDKARAAIAKATGKQA